MRKSDIFQFQSQALSAMIIIQSAEKKPARWESRTVISRKGKLIGVGGEIKPKDPPAYRVLSEKAYQEFSYGKFETLNDIDKFESYLKNRDSSSEGINKIEILNSPKNDVNVAFEILDNVFDEIEKAGDFVKKAISELYKNLEVDKILSQIKKTIDDNQFLSGVASVLDNAVKLGGQVGKATGKLIREALTKASDYLKTIDPRVLKGIALGALIVAGISGIGLLDIAIFGSRFAITKDLAISLYLQQNRALFLAAKIARVSFGVLLATIIEFINKKIKNKSQKDHVSSIIKSIPSDEEKVSKEKVDPSSPEYRANEIIEHSRTSLEASDIDINGLRKRLISQFNRESIKSAYLIRPKGEIKLDPNIQYTTERRVLELQQINEQLSKEKDPEKIRELQESYQWHIGLIETDIKYGDILDRIIDVDTTKKFSRRKNTIVYGDPDSELHNKLIEENMNELLQKLSTGKEDIPKGKVIGSKVDDPITGQSRIDEAVVLVDEIMNLSNSRPSVKIDLDKPRAYMYDNKGDQTSFNLWKLFSNSDTTDVKINIGMGTDVGFTIFHEYGHAIEISQKMGHISENYAISRSTSKELAKLKELTNAAYRDDELAYPSDFTKPYTAKYYPPRDPGNKSDNRQSTEVVSIAVQNLSSATSLKYALDKDREHILYGLWALDYKP